MPNERTKEEVYDAEISPLMVQIIQLCKDHDIPMAAQFQLDDVRPVPDDAEEGPLVCTTALGFPGSCGSIRRAIDAMKPEPQAFAFTITNHGKTD